MTHAPGEISVQCLIGKCGACPDAECEHPCHPARRASADCDMPQAVTLLWIPLSVIVLLLVWVVR